MTDDQIKAILTVKAGKIVWKERTADFYAASFSKAYDPDGAADHWNRTRAGNSPAWRSKDGEPSCMAMLRPLSLRAACAALGLSYEEQKEAVREQEKRKNETAARNAVLRAVELKGGLLVWKIRTQVSHPSADPAALVAFNSRYAGKPIKSKGGLMKINYNTVPEKQVMAWVKEAKNET